MFHYLFAGPANVESFHVFVAKFPLHGLHRPSVEDVLGYMGESRVS